MPNSVTPQAYSAGSNLKLGSVGANQDMAQRDAAAGELLADLERRQDDVLLQLDELDKKLTSLLSGLGVTFLEEDEQTNSSMIRLADLGNEDDDQDEINDEGKPSVSDGFSSLPMKRRAA